MRTKISLLSALIAVFTFSNSYSQSVLICGSPVEAVWLTDVQMKIQATYQFGTVDIFNTSVATPSTATMLGYDAILNFTDVSPVDPTLYGNNLASYIDQGGGVVNCVFAVASVPVLGAFGTTTYAVAEFANAQTQNVPLSLGTVVNPIHPILSGVNSFQGGSSSYNSPGTAFAPGSSVNAYWSNGQWLVATRENVGPMGVRRADLNFYPPSSDARSDFWNSTTNGGLLMANALTWVMNPNMAGCTDASACNYNPAATTNDGSCTFASLYYPDADADGYGDSQAGISGNYTMQSVPFTMETPSIVNQGPICDDCLQTIPIGFNFSFYGQPYGNVTISSNGYVTFDNAMSSGCCSGELIPQYDGVNNAIYLGRSDWFPYTQGLVTYYNLTSPNRLVVEFNAVPRCCDQFASDIMSGQMVLFENGQIQLNISYLNHAGNTVTTGVENIDGTLAAGPGQLMPPISISNTSYLFTYSSGNAGEAIYACTQPAGYVSNNIDCDDAVNTTNPGASEICINGVDDNCSGVADENCPILGCTDATACNFNASANTDDGSCDYGSDYYADLDGDGYGAGSPTSACTQPAGYVTNNTDCDDTNSNLNPGVNEICNQIDDDCNGLADDGLNFTDYYADNDNDGFGAGSPTNSCVILGQGYVTNNTDCNNADANVNPNMTEVCNQIDDNCNNSIDDGLVFNNYFVDSDTDGFGAGTPINSCTALGLGYVIDNSDCNDADANVNPNAIEIGGNGIDENCDGQIDNSVFEFPDNGFVIYPNPTSQFIIVKVDSYYAGKYYAVCNALGDEVAHGQINSNNVTIDLSVLSEGTYFFRIELETKPFILIR